MRLRYAALAAVVLGLAACGGPGPEPSGPSVATSPSSGTASTVPDDEPVAAADGTDYEACFDATCEVVVETGTEIGLDENLGWGMPAGLDIDGWSLLTVDDIADGSVGVTLSGDGASSGGSTATIITADGTQFYLDGLLVEAVEAPDGQAVLSLAWG
jgi:predicted small lipoprotein YifL